MAAWPDVHPVYSRWGAVWPHTGYLVVVDPAVPQHEAPPLLEALRADHEPSRLRRTAIGITAVQSLFVLAGITVYLTTSWAELGLAVLMIPALLLLPSVVGSWKASADAHDRRQAQLSAPAPFHVRAGMTADLWALVRHFNSYRQADPETADAIRALLTALAHTGPENDQLLAALADEFSGWSEHPAAVIRSTAVRVWADLPRRRPSSQWAWPELVALAAKERDARRRSA